MTAADRPSVTDDARAEAWDEGYQDGLRQGGEGEDGPRYVNPYRAAARAETTTATTEDAALTIRYATLDDGTVELDEVFADNATVHLEKMDTASWWLGIDVNGEHLAVNLGVDEDGDEFAHAEPEMDKVDVELDGKPIASLYPPGLVTSRPLATARTRPTREQVTAAIGDAANSMQIGFGVVSIAAAVDAVLALWADQPTETTDAQVLAALNAMYPKAAAPSLDYWGAEADKMRAALRAAWTEAE